MSDVIVNGKDDRKEKKKRRQIESVTDDVPEKDPGRKKKKKKPHDIDVDSTTVENDTSVKKKKKKHHDRDIDTTPKEKRKKDHETTKSKKTKLEKGSEKEDGGEDEYLQSNNISISSTNLKISPILSFSTLYSNPRFPSSLKQSLVKFDSPTPIQACAWPAALLGLDVVGIAETGSGKTLAFCIPLIAHILNQQIQPTTNPQIKALIIAPTRELAIQTHDTLSDLSSSPFPLPDQNSDVKVKITSVAVFGGVDKDGQRNLLSGGAGANSGSGGKKIKKDKKRKYDSENSEPLIEVIVVVGTPGRIKDLVQEGSCDLSQVTYLVLDEADRMLDKGFENEIRQIIGFTASSSSDNGVGRRQTLMFSATWPPSVRQLASTFLNDPVRITVGSDELTANRRVEQVLEVFDDEREKDSRLLKHLTTILSNPSNQNTLILIFALYKLEATRVSQFLISRSHQSNNSFRVSTIQGDLPQHQRLAALNKFKSGESNILVATDVAARGLDIPNVSVVINYTFPLTVEDYVHRIGRTGRGRGPNAHGKSITLFTGNKHERALAGELARVLRESGFDDQAKPLREKFPMSIKKKVHSVYGNWFKDDVGEGKEGEAVKPTHLVFD